ncbi:hypothetical protein ABMX48_00065 [Streptomyces cavourensis]
MAVEVVPSPKFQDLEAMVPSASVDWSVKVAFSPWTAVVTAAGGTNPPGNQAPTAAFTTAVQGLKATFTDQSTDGRGERGGGCLVAGRVGAPPQSPAAQPASRMYQSLL